jgi:hypothetical protein
MLPDRHDRMQVMGTCAKRAARGGSERFHRSIIGARP